jgi:ribosome-interacting GTPase 1
MPTNLPPEYHRADERFRAARSTDEKIAALEDLYGTIPKHKGTDKLRADVRRRLARLRDESRNQKRAPGRHESAFHVVREGAGQAALVGPTNTGKSALLRALTHARPEVADYPFTTWTPTPGMMPIDDIQVQLVDTPPVHREHVEPAMFDLIRHADLLLEVVDLTDEPLRQFDETNAILMEHRVVPLPLMDRAANPERSEFLPALILANKNDDALTDEDAAVFSELLGSSWTVIPVSAAGRNFDLLKKRVFETLSIIRVYSKPPGKKPEMGSPFVLKRGSTVADFAAKVHHDFLAQLASARVWGEGVRDGQLAGRDHPLNDGDVVELKTHSS